MSSCLILQDKNNFYIGADTACSVNINGKYYRYSDNIEKIFTHGEDVYFCSGNMSVVNSVTLWISTVFCNKKYINVELLSKLLKQYWPCSNKDIFDAEIMICRKENNTPIIYQLSQYNNYNPVLYKPKDIGINILCCGYKTNELYNESRQILLQGHNNIKDLYQNVFNKIYDNKVGGNIILYHNKEKIMNCKIQEHDIEYTTNISDFYLLIAEAVLSGYIESSQIVGCDINIGDGAFVVDGETGVVTRNASGNNIDGYAKEEYVNNKIKEIQNQVGDINAAKMYRVEITTEDPTVISTTTDQATMICKVYSWDTDITDTLDASIFNWKRSSGDSASDEIWNSMPEHQGVKTITIDADDVYENSSFICEVDLPE